MSRPPVTFQRTFVTPATADLRTIYIRDTIVVDDTGAVANVPLLLPKIGTAYAPLGKRIAIVKASNVAHAVAITPAALDAVSSGTPGAFPDFGAAGAANSAALPASQPGSITLEATDMNLTGSVQPNPAGGTPTTAGAWLAIDSGTGGSGSAAATTIFGSYGNPATGTPRVGDRPLASSVPAGTTWIPTDDRVLWTSGPKLANPTESIWFPASSPAARTIPTNNGGLVPTVAQHLGFYDPVANTFIMATAVGQLCNAVAATAAAAGAPMFVIIFPASCALSAAWAGATGDEFMTDATGFGIPYVAALGRVPLGVAITPTGLTVTLAFLMYEY